MLYHGVSGTQQAGGVVGSVRRVAAVQGDSRACDVVRCSAGKEHRRTGEVAGLSPAASWDTRRYECVPLAVRRLLVSRAQVGAYSAG